MPYIDIHAQFVKLALGCSDRAPVNVQLYGNPLELLPELSPCASLRHLSLANVRISADDDFENWTVEVSLMWVCLLWSPARRKFAVVQCTFTRMHICLPCCRWSRPHHTFHARTSLHRCVPSSSDTARCSTRSLLAPWVRCLDELITNSVCHVCR